MHKSIATINSPEFVNLQPLDINPLMSKCEIKVLYIGENRNRSYISKEVATEMAKTLRGAPIVGYYKEEKNDFADHGQQMIIDDEGIKFKCLTVPYGFVSPDAKVWFQTFEDTDDFGNIEEKEYLMTTGYLWTGQFKECQAAIDKNGRPQSMELDEESLNGHWATNNDKGMEFFIINDAIFSKLCILGDDVEPCFEGSSVTAPKVSTSFTKMDDEFKKTLFIMMQELQFALQGGQQMENEVGVTEIVAEQVVEQTAPETPSVVEEVTDTNSVPVADTFAAPKKEEEEEKEKSKTKEEKEEASKDKVDDNKKEESTDDSDNQKDNDEEEEKKKKNFELLQSDYETLQEKYTLLEKERDELLEFKRKVEDAEKDAMIQKFCFLSETDKKDVIENKSKYTLEEIESKLSVICVRNKVNFNLDNNEKNDINTERDIITYNLSDNIESIPAWVRAVQNTQNKK